MGVGSAKNNFLITIKNILIAIVTTFITFFLICQIFFPVWAFNIFGIRLYIISYTRSMEPVLEYNDLIVVQKVDFNKLEKHDIITFHSVTESGESITITHEIIDIQVDSSGKRYIKTKGKNVAYPDLIPVTDDGDDNTNRYIGMYVTKSAFLGNFIAYIQSRQGLTALIVNIAGAFILGICIGHNQKKSLLNGEQLSCKANSIKIKN